MILENKLYQTKIDNVFMTQKDNDTTLQLIEDNKDNFVTFLSDIEAELYLIKSKYQYQFNLDYKIIVYGYVGNWLHISLIIKYIPSPYNLNLLYLNNITKRIKNVISTFGKKVKNKNIIINKENNISFLFYF